MKAKKEKPAKAPKVKKEKKRKGGDAPLDGDAFAAPVAKTKKAKAPARKVPADVYTLVLLLSFLFFTAACVMLYLDLGSYVAP
ncbi:MAG: hypothetical protein IKU86_10150 [Thermoguttaceae bacterium]|nr:hypothetical protein [Thermoguttaceae bacterium]